MKKPYLYIGLILILAGIGWYVYQGNGGARPSSEEATVSNGKSSGSFGSLLAMSSPQQCSFSSTDATGTAYVATNRMRGDFTTETTGAKQTGHIITKDNTSYVWMDGETQGFMMKTTASASNTGQSPINMNDKVDYSCKAWRVDESKFSQPTDVKFTDYSKLLDDLQNNPSNIDLKQFGL